MSECELFRNAPPPS